jgi:hypothetical protein
MEDGPMGQWEHQIERRLERLEREAAEIKKDAREILWILRRHHPQPPPPPNQLLTRSIAVRFTGEWIPMPNNILVLNVGQTSTASIQPFLADGVTPSGGVLSNVSYSFADPSATVVLNSDGLTALVTGVADSAGVAVQGIATATVTDTDGVISQWSQMFTIQTIGVIPPEQLTQSIAVQFTVPA